MPAHFLDVVQRPAPPNFGAAIRRFRALRGITQTELAELAEVAPETVSRLERNKFSPSFDIISRLARALDVRVDDLSRPAAAPKPKQLRPAEARLLHLVKHLDEPQVREVVRSVQTLLDIGSRFSRKRER